MNKQYYQSRTGFITQSALIAALYVVLTMIVAPIAFGPIQFRVSEVLCVLPYFLTSAVPLAASLLICFAVQHHWM